MCTIHETGKEIKGHIIKWAHMLITGFVFSLGTQEIKALF